MDVFKIVLGRVGIVVDVEIVSIFRVEVWVGRN